MTIKANRDPRLMPMTSDQIPSNRTIFCVYLCPNLPSSTSAPRILPLCSKSQNGHDNTDNKILLAQFLNVRAPTTTSLPFPHGGGPTAKDSFGRLAPAQHQCRVLRHEFRESFPIPVDNFQHQLFRQMVAQLEVLSLLKRRDHITALRLR